MSRPKGSKNKKTIEKEKTIKNEKITVWRVEKVEKTGDEAVENEAPTENMLVGECEKNLPLSDEKNMGAEEKENPEENPKEIESPKETDWDNFEFENEDPPVASRMRSKSSEKKVSVCKRCGEELIVAPCRVDTNMIAGRVSTHREHPRFVTICMKCATELSEVVDKWLGNYPTKWEDHSDGY